MKVIALLSRLFGWLRLAVKDLFLQFRLIFIIIFIGCVGTEKQVKSALALPSLEESTDL